MEKITQVTVYQDRALITRSQSLPIESEKADSKTISFLNIPQSLFFNTIRAKGEGSAGFKIRSINQRYEYLEAIPDEKIAQMRLTLEELENQSFVVKEKSKKMDEFSLLLSQLKLKNFNTLLPDFNYQKISWDEMEKLYYALVSKREKIEEQTFVFRKEDRDLQEKKKALSKNLSKSESGKTKTLLNFDLSVDVLSNGTGDFHLSYVVPDAGWRPFYEARLFLDKAELEMVYLAEVTQKTGEDWNEVELVLSTARPSQGASLPELTPWWIDFYSPPKFRKSAAKKEFAKSVSETNFAGSPAMVDSKVCIEPECEEKELEADEFISEIAYSEVQSEGLNVSFLIPKKDSIGSDGTAKKVTVDKKRFPVKIEYIVIPKISPSPFLKVSFENQASYPYLSGDALIFHASDYVGKSKVETTVPGEEMELFMGIDENIKVERQLLSQMQSKKLFGGNKRTTYKYKTTLTNFRENEVKVTVLDHLPIPESSEIKVKVDSIAPQYQEIDKKNIMKWELVLNPKEKKEILFEFTLEYPKEMTPNGI